MESGKVRNTFVRRLTRQCSQLLNASYEHEAIGFPPSEEENIFKNPHFALLSPELFNDRYFQKRSLSDGIFLPPCHVENKVEISWGTSLAHDALGTHLAVHLL